MSEVTRKELFDGFWKTANFDVQNAFLCGCVKVFATKRKGVKSPSRRQFSSIYYVQNGPVSVRVCKTSFLAIFGISNGRLERALSSQAEEGGVPHQDQRGRHVPANKTPQEKIEQIKEHIAKFPATKAIIRDVTIRIVNTYLQISAFRRCMPSTKITALSKKLRQ